MVESWQARVRNESESREINGRTGYFAIEYEHWIELVASVESLQ